jgi:hypothetical protein
MEVQVDSDKLFEAYEKAENDDAREQLREIILGGKDSVRALYPPTRTAIGPIDVDADEIVEELKEIQDNDVGAFKTEDDTVGIDEAREMLNDQAPHGGVVEAGKPVYGELYVYGPDMSADRFEPPAGWRAFETDNGQGVGFTRSDGPKTVDELFDYLEDLHGDDNLFHIGSWGSAEYEQLYYIGDMENLPDGWVRDTDHRDHNYVKHAEP